MKGMTTISSSISSVLQAILGSSERDEEPLRPYAVAPGERVYAIGDIHGEAGMLAALLDAIEADAADADGPVRIICVGDYIDRGPDSCGVIDLLIRRSATEGRYRFLRGNHEMLMERFLFDGDGAEPWLRNGGSETCLSYGVDPTAVPSDDSLSRWLHSALHEAVPQAHRNFLDNLDASSRSGDYLFVHAGIRPGVPLEEQTPQDMCWIRQPFLSSRRDHGVMVVHGHTPVSRPEFRSNRIAVDTGAVYGGTLTALGLEGTERWILGAHKDPDDAGIMVANSRRAAA